MDGSRRAFIGGAAAVAGLSLLPGKAFAAADGAKTYAVIEIRAAAMSVSLYRFDLEQIAGTARLSGFERMAPQLTEKPFPESEMASPLGADADDARVAQSIDDIARYVESLKTRFGMDARDVAVLVSNSAVDVSPERVARFTAALRAKTGIVADLISIREQSRLGFDWIVRRGRRNKVLHLDVSSGYTKGGYYDQSGVRAQFFGLSAPYGTKNMAGAVKQRWPETRTADFGPRSAEFFGDTVEPLLAPQIEAAPSPAERPQLCLTGGIVWASIVIVQPEAIASRQAWVDVAPDQFATVLRLIENGTPYGGPLPASLGDEERARVLAALMEVRNTFNPHQLAAGAAIGDGLSRQLRFDERKDLIFPSFASFAGNIWVSQFLIEKFG